MFIVPLRILITFIQVLQFYPKLQLLTFLESLDIGQNEYPKKQSWNCVTISAILHLQLLLVGWAFDTLKYGNLIEKLRSYGILSTELEWFKCYLFNRRQIWIGNYQRTNQRHQESHRAPFWLSYSFYFSTMIWETRYTYNTVLYIMLINIFIL